MLSSSAKWRLQSHVSQLLCPRTSSKEATHYSSQLRSSSMCVTSIFSLVRTLTSMLCVYAYRSSSSSSSSFSSSSSSSSSSDFASCSAFSSVFFVNQIRAPLPRHVLDFAFLRLSYATAKANNAENLMLVNLVSPSTIQNGDFGGT